MCTNSAHDTRVSHSVCEEMEKKRTELTTYSTIIGSAFIQISVYTFHKNLNFIHVSRLSHCLISIAFCLSQAYFLTRFPQNGLAYSLAWSVFFLISRKNAFLHLLSIADNPLANNWSKHILGLSSNAFWMEIFMNLFSRFSLQRAESFEVLLRKLKFIQKYVQMCMCVRPEQCPSCNFISNDTRTGQTGSISCWFIHDGKMSMKWIFLIIQCRFPSERPKGGEKEREAKFVTMS